MTSSSAQLEVLAVIPARGGSKGVPRKNLRSLAGKPLLAHSVEVALRSPAVSRVLVSTDDEEIAAVARHHGAEVPFLRPSALAADDTPGVMPVLHAVEWLEEAEGYRPDVILLLQPTSPLREGSDIQGALDLLTQPDAMAVVSVQQSQKHPQWMLTLDEEQKIRWFLEGQTPAARRQDLPPVYALNGAVYAIKRWVLLRERTLLPAGVQAFVMPAERSLDIDTELDLKLAELVLQERMSS